MADALPLVAWPPAVRPKMANKGSGGSRSERGGPDIYTTWKSINYTGLDRDRCIAAQRSIGIFPKQPRSWSAYIVGNPRAEPDDGMSTYLGTAELVVAGYSMPRAFVYGDKRRAEARSSKLSRPLGVIIDARR
jgi:hypothetical protein